MNSLNKFTAFILALSMPIQSVWADDLEERVSQLERSVLRLMDRVAELERGKTQPPTPPLPRTELRITSFVRSSDQTNVGQFSRRYVLQGVVNGEFDRVTWEVTGWPASGEVQVDRSGSIRDTLVLNRIHNNSVVIKVYLGGEVIERKSLTLD